jgi:hypothetical protein
MKMLGLAPVAAVAPKTPTDTGWRGATPSYVANNIDDLDSLSDIECAKKRVEALKWAKENSFDRASRDELHTRDAIDADVVAMKSWSPAYRAMALNERALNWYSNRKLENAIADLEREVKLSMAPEWARRFLE